MCFSFDSLPPDLPADLALPPLGGGAAAELLELTSEDGTRFSVAVAEAPGSDAAAVVILPDVRGLYRFYVELAERFAQAGHPAVAIDYFGRTAGVGERDEEFEYMPHVMQTRVDQIQADANVALAELRDRAGARPAATVGFCFGGTQSFLANASRRIDLAGVVGFYGGLDTTRWGIASPAERAEKKRKPVLGLFGGADEGVTPGQGGEVEGPPRGARGEHRSLTPPHGPHP